ncbi:MAG: hypothetical protein ACQEQI_01595 [Bacillota bacterium]
MADSKVVKENLDVESESKFFVQPTGSIVGLLSTLGLGFIIYFLLNNIRNVSQWLSYNEIVAKAGDNIGYKFIWFLMNFTEAEFYAGVLASLGIIIGGFIAWRLDVKRSKWAGFNVSYGTNLWPWVFGSQLISLFIAIFVLNFTRYFSGGDYTWLPTFISVVGVPPAVMLIYGPSIRALLTGSTLGGILSFPIAFWLMNNILPILEVPGVVANVFTMAITGVIVLEVCRVLPWLEQKELNLIKSDQPKLSADEKLEQMSKPTWFIRRVLADFSEAQFYGNEIAGGFILLGVSLDWILNTGHAAYGSGAIPAIILSQFIGAAVGVYLYFNKYVEDGWYATYVPVVSVGPGCVLMFGASIPVAVFAGVLGGILGGPVAEYLAVKLPEELHPTIANVTSMGICTIVVSVVMKALPWF